MVCTNRNSVQPMQMTNSIVKSEACCIEDVLMINNINKSAKTKLLFIFFFSRLKIYYTVKNLQLLLHCHSATFIEYRYSDK